MFDGRKRISTVLATLCIIALGGSMLGATPSYAKPNIGDVQAKVQKLYHEAEQASERYNNAREDLQRSRARLTTLSADLGRQQAKVEAVREQVAASVVSQYQGQALSSTSQVFLSNNPGAFLDQLATVSQYNDQQAQMMADFAIQAKQLELRKQASERELAKIAKTKKSLATQKAEIDKKAGEAKSLLSRLKSEAASRANSVSRGVDLVPLGNVSVGNVSVGNAPVSGRAAAAVSYALAKVGDAYSYGAAGPDAFDCSGLTMMAWAQAGVSLPHSSSAQMGSGMSVSQSALQPGDLVFYYSPVSHVGIYIGNGQIVHAANPSTGVQVAPVFSMPYSGAVRPG